MEGQRRGRVWIVEDSPLEAEMARRALADQHDVEIVADGTAVLERLATSPAPDALVLDWYLPGMSGLEVCHFIRAERDAMMLPILLLTVFGRKEDLIEGLSVGANDYVTKPYHVAELQGRVATLVRTAHLYQAQRWRAQQLKLGAELGEILTKGGTPRDVADACCRVALDRLGLDAIAMFGVEHGGVSRIASAGAASAIESVLPNVTGADRAARASDHVLDDRRSLPVRPLVVAGETLGVVAAVASGEDASAKVEAFDSIVDTLALGFARARAEEERRDLLERERAARSEAVAANRAKDDFLAMVSHELRTPLNAIAGWARLLLAPDGTADPARLRRALETIDRNVAAQTQLIGDLLDISRIVSGKLRLDVESVDVGMVVSTAVESLKLAAESKGLRLAVVLGEGRASVQGDPDRLQQVVWNLVSNAIKFTPRGGAVTVSTRVADDAIEVSVEDTGQGIEPSFLPHVFERFRQADSALGRIKGGLGLGLAIVRHLVELHGGTVEAESAGLEKGARFAFRIPMPAKASVSAAPPRRELPGSEQVRGLRVLVVDDEADARDLIAMFLRESKVVVFTAADAPEAFRLVQEERPDVIVSDIGLPGEDGLSFMRRVRGLAKDDGGRAPAIALTAYARPQDRTQALAAGFTEHVVKPIDPLELLALVGRVARDAVTGDG